MEEFIVIENKKYLVNYDRPAVCKALDGLDIVKPTSRPIVERAIIYYACLPKKLKTVFNALAVELNLMPSTVATHIRNAIITAEFNGGLKNIDDLFGAEIYDYDYGLSSKNFLAIMSSHLKNSGLIIVKNGDKRE